MKNLTNIESQDNQHLEQNPVDKQTPSLERPKMNYWMISTIILLILLFAFGGFYLFNSRFQKNIGSPKKGQTQTVPTKNVPTPEVTKPPVAEVINKIVILKDRGLALINPDGTGLTQIYTPPDKQGSNYVNEVAWSLDGKKLAFSLGKNMFSGASGSDLSIMVLDLGSNRTEVLVPNAGYHSAPSWSPDSKKIAFNANGIIKVVNVETKSSIDIATDAYSLPTGDLQGNVMYYNPTSVVWSVRNQIFYLQRVGEQNTSSTERRLSVVSPDGKNKAIFVPDKNLGVYNAIAVSKDGTKIAYIENDKGIWLVSSDGSNNQQLTKEPIPDSILQWSPDGKRLLATGGLGGIYLVYTDDGRIIPLTSGGGASWSPDSKQIVYTAQKPNVIKGGEIKLYSLDKGAEEKISDSFMSTWETAWSPL